MRLPLRLDPLRRVALCALLAGCATSSPPVRLYHLRTAPPAAARPIAATAMQWQLMLPVKVPDYLDREPVLLPHGRSGLQALPGHRWAESLRDSVPRVLKHDLATLLGAAQVWAAPLPPGLTIGRQLRVELTQFESDAGGQAVTLAARWSLADPQGVRPLVVDSATITVPSDGSDVDSLVAAHRLALWRLAERLVATP